MLPECGGFVQNASEVVCGGGSLHVACVDHGATNTCLGSVRNRYMSVNRLASGVASGGHNCHICVIRQKKESALRPVSCWIVHYSRLLRGLWRRRLLAYLFEIT